MILSLCMFFLFPTCVAIDIHSIYLTPISERFVTQNNRDIQANRFK